MKGIPTLIQEQNSYPGITNKILGKKVNCICVAYDGLDRFFPKDKIVKTGNPVRKDLLSISGKSITGKDFFKLKHNNYTLLVLGGSLGARRINQLIESQLPLFESQKVQLIWQCGKLYYEEYKHYHDGINIRVMPFIDRMDMAYAAADVIISRAGASSVSELCIVGKPVVFIPSPNVAEDHQTKNALAVANKEAAILVKEADLDQEFTSRFTELLNSSELRDKLSRNIKSLAMPNATSDIVSQVEKLLKAS
jgi:UDP-N-acetylglucosamine--N-acetylmuramyl-(pentapeptide) pyrophosphoryl-undecaprenol N-acetylglucosamine transferase